MGWLLSKGAQKPKKKSKVYHWATKALKPAARNQDLHLKQSETRFGVLCDYVWAVSSLPPPPPNFENKSFPSPIPRPVISHNHRHGYFPKIGDTPPITQIEDRRDPPPPPQKGNLYVRKPETPACHKCCFFIFGSPSTLIDWAPSGRTCFFVPFSSRRIPEASERG